MAAVALAWSLTALTAALAALLALAPAANWRALALALGATTAYALMAALLGSGAMQASQQLWGATASLTFELVRRVLTPMLPTLLADPATRVLSTENFAISVADVCSGLEGVGLMLAFSAVLARVLPARVPLSAGARADPDWHVRHLRVQRREDRRAGADRRCRISGRRGVRLSFPGGLDRVQCRGLRPRVILKPPQRLASRRAAGAGAPPAVTAAAGAETDNPTAVYLMPLLAMLAAGLVSNALSGRFEYAYPLRTIAVAAALWIYRTPLRRIDWRFSWRAPLVGLCVFAFWWSAARWLVPAADRPLGLAAMRPLLQVLWIACRLGTAVILVPIAEELA